MKNEMALLSKFSGCMIGSAIGDAIGELAFTHPAKKELLKEIQKKDLLKYTDDTAMAIGLAEALIELGDIEITHLGRIFKDNFFKEPWRGYGIGPPAVFEMVEKGWSYQSAASSLFNGSGSYGNGACMRIAPIGLFFYNNSDIAEKAVRSAIVTHSHPLAIEGAVVMAKATAINISLDDLKEFNRDGYIDELKKEIKTDIWKNKLNDLKLLLKNNSSIEEVSERLGTGVAAFEAVPFALYAFLCFPHSFKDCLFCAILNGGDRDTIGAMACALSGTYLGMNAVPRSWIEKLENKEQIYALAKRLFDKKDKKPV